MKTKLLLIALLLLMVTCLGLNFWCYINTTKIAYVRSSEVIENYLGMKEARDLYGQKIKGWNKNSDSLTAGYNTAIEYLKDNKTKLNKFEIIRLQEDIAKKEVEIKSFNESIEKLAEEENENLTQGALNQINSYIEKYAEDHHIDIIIGVTLSGNVLYGADRIDITNDIIDGLNKSYK